jgi:hypothetical protein
LADAPAEIQGIPAKNRVGEANNLSNLRFWEARHPKSGILAFFFRLAAQMS